MEKNNKYYGFYILSALICSFFTLLISVPYLFAETGYVSDMLILSLKEGPGRQYNTIKTLRSNTQVEIIEETERFLKVKTLEGDFGWVESQYITKELPKVLIIEQLNKKILQLEGRKPNSAIDVVEGIVNDNQSLKSESQASLVSDSNRETEYTNKIKSLEAALNTQIEKNRLLEAQFRNLKSQQSQITSEQNIQENNIVEIKEQNIQENIYQKNENMIEEDESSLFLGKDMKDIMVIPDDDILKTAMIKWFCAGAGVLIAGWFIGRSFSGGKRGGGLLD